MAGCIDMAITNTVKNVLYNLDLTPVSGHEYVEIDSGDINIQRLKCSKCGKISDAWKYNEVELEYK